MSGQNLPHIASLLKTGLQDAVIVVVGGTGGIGREVVRQASEFGARTVVGGRTKPNDDPAMDGSTFVPIDITDSDSVRKFADAVRAAFARIDILVNTAGSSVQLPPGRIDALTDDVIDTVMASNARAPLVVTRELVPLLQKGRDPVIVNVSSIAAQTGGGSNMAYAASKAALDTLAKALAKALAPEIRVVNISPSALETAFAQGRDENFLTATVEASALRRLATPVEVATSIICAARLLTATTGVSIAVDAGRHL